MSQTESKFNRFQARRTEIDTPATFDTQFWPVVIGLCTLSAFSAGATVALFDGVALFASLMVIAILFFVLLLVLRLVDNRRFRRSLQLGLLLSMAIHLLFLICASRVHIFGDDVATERVERQAVKQPRVLKISPQRKTNPLLEVNEVPTPTPEEKTPEREKTPTTTDVKPQPVEIETKQPTTDPKIVKRENKSQTVPKLGKSLSQTRRSETNEQPNSSMKVETSAASSASSSSSSSSQPTANVEVERSSAAADNQISRNQKQNQKIAQGISDPEITRQSRRQPTAEKANPDSMSRRSERPVSEPKPTASEVATNSGRTSSQSSRVQMEAPKTEVTRNSPARSDISRNRVSPTNSRSSLTEQTATPQRRTTTNSTSAEVVPETRTTQRRSANVAETPRTPNNTETPRASSGSVASSNSPSVSTPEFSISRSESGSAGIGRSKNVAKETGSKQSPAMVSSQSARRESQQNNATPSDAFSSSTESRTPGRVADSLKPSSTMVAQASPSASRSATRNVAEVSENASASLQNSTANEHRDEISAERGQAEADFGANRVVQESTLDKVEGGGQPELNMERSENRSRRSELANGESPALSSEVASETDAAQRAAPSSRSAEMSDLNARADLNSRDGGSSAIEQGPSSRRTADRSDVGASEAPDSDPNSRRSGSKSDVATTDNRSNESSSGRNNSDDDAMPSSDMLVESESRLAGSRRTGDGQSMSSPSVEAERESNSGSINFGMANSRSRLESSGGIGTQSDPSRRSGQGEQASMDSNSLRSNRNGRADDDDALAVDMSVESNGEGAARANDSRGADLSSQIDRVTSIERQSNDGMSLDIEAPRGAAGLGREFEMDPGINSRRASQNSEELLPSSDSRFIREDTGGVPNSSADAIAAAKAFRSRRQSNRSAAPETEEAIELGLAFLARHQSTDGSWSLGQFDVNHPEQALQYHSDAAATGLALLSFQGAGYNHREFKYAEQMSQAIDWLVENQKPDGELFVESDNRTNGTCRFYSHGIAALALAEAYGMTQDPALRRPAQMAIKYIEDTQHASYGGWRYAPGKSSDTSVSGWMVMALQSGRLAGLDVEQKTLDGIESWLNVARDANNEHLFRYNPNAVDDEKTLRSHGRIPTKCMTSVGLLMRLYMGWNRNDQRLINGAEYLLTELPSDATEESRDTYYWYYATQVLRHVGGTRWEKWHDALHPLLVGSQVKEGDMSGSWHPYEPVPDVWGRKGGGRLYVTTMNLLSLEVDYRLLPLYDETSK